jgi:hypothetical protein
MHTAAPALPASTSIAFVGGGNMASAIIGGLIRRGLAAAQILVVEPFEAARAALLAQHGVAALHGRQRRAGQGARPGRLGGQAAELQGSRPADPLSYQAGAAPERGRRHPQRQHRQLARHPAHRARHAQHAGTGRQGG